MVVCGEEKGNIPVLPAEMTNDESFSFFLFFLLNSQYSPPFLEEKLVLRKRNSKIIKHEEKEELILDTRWD